MDKFEILTAEQMCITHQNITCALLSKATDPSDAMTLDHRFRLISYFVFSAGLLPWSAPRFSSDNCLASLSLSNDAHEGRCFV